MSDDLSGYYEVAVGERAVYLRVHGLGSMNNCLCVRDFLEDMVEDHRGFVVVDLEDCTGMDSTFMGVLAGIATYEVDGRPVGVAVVNGSPQLVKLLRGVGLTELVYVDPQPFDPPPLEFHRLEEQPSEEDRLKLIRAAHEHLIEISEENEKLFGPLVKTIEREMRDRGILRE